MSGGTVARLGLGAVRFGRSRGPEARARPPEFEASAILDVAARAGVSLIDTAPGVEDILGQVLPQTSAFRLTVKAAPEAVEQSARTSLRRLKVDHADALIVSAAALAGEGGVELWRQMEGLREAGLFSRLGIAADADEDPTALAARFRPDLMQLPFSLLDQRLAVSGALGEIAGAGVDIQLYSVLMQGRLFAPSAGAPRGSEIDARVSRARRRIAEAGADPLQAALAFALSRPEASSVIVGVTSGAQLRAVIAAACAPSPMLDWAALAPEAKTQVAA